MVVLDNGAPLDVSAACVLRLGSTDVSVPAAVDIPATLPTNSADTTTTVALTAAVSTPGVLTLACTDNDGSGSVGATGTLSALTVGSAQVVGGTTPVTHSVSPSPTASSSS